MLANHVAHCRQQLTTCQPRERFERQRALTAALEHLKDYVAMPDPDRAKEIAAVKRAMKRAALDSGPESFAIHQRALAL